MLITSAAICYTIPFYSTHVFGLIIWLFPIFIALALTNYHIPWFWYVIWSIVTVSIHLLAINKALFAMASGSLAIRLVPPLALTLYVSIYPITWLIGTSWLLARPLCKTMPKKIFTCAVYLWLYLLAIDLVLLWPFGRCEGYVFMNPLLPLCISPLFVAPLTYLPLPIVLLWYCTIASIAALWIMSRTINHSVALLLAIAPWIVLACTIPYSPAPSWLTKIGHLPLMLGQTTSTNTASALISFELSKLHKQYPSLALVIMPESSWNGSNLTNRPTLGMLKNHPISNLIIGSFAHEKDRYFNSLYWYQNGTQKARFDKRHAVPLTERTFIGGTKISNNLFCQNSPPVSRSEKSRLPLSFAEIATFIPYICSELFCNHLPDDPYTHPILAITNDWWFTIPHFKKLMALSSRLRAMQWKRPILYVSFSYAQFFDTYGVAHPIATTPLDHTIA